MTPQDGLVIDKVSAAHPNGPDVVHGVSFVAPSGALTALLGPNGAGKSTLFKGILGIVAARGGVHLDGEDLLRLKAQDRARRIAYVPQHTLLSAPLPVREVVALGRFAHRGPLAGPTRGDQDAVDQAMNDAGVSVLADRAFTELSGGEQQRVLLARALATGAHALLLDEPTSALDVRQRLLLHRVLRRLAEAGRCVVVVLHDLEEARVHADRAVLLKDGRVHTAGPVTEVITHVPVRQVYGVELVEGSGLGWRLPEDGEDRP